MKKLDWEVRDFAKSIQDSGAGVSPLGLGKRLCSEFETLVLKCKDRAEELATAVESKPLPLAFNWIKAPGPVKLGTAQAVVPMLPRSLITCWS